jgi:hypothetical protein
MRKTMTQIVREEVQRALRTERLDAVARRFVEHDELEARPRIYNSTRMRAETMAAGIAASRGKPLEPGSFTGVGGIRVSDVPDDETAEERETRLATRAAENYRKQMQTERHAREADAVAAEWIGAEHAEDGEATTFRAKVAALIPRRTKPGDDASYEIV